MAIITIGACVEYQADGHGLIRLYICGASPDIATDLENTFPALGLPASHDSAAEWVGKSQPNFVTLAGTIAAKPQTAKRYPDQNEFDINLLEEVTSYLNFLTKYKFSVVSVTRDPPTKYNNGQPSYTWTLQQPLNQSAR